MGACPTVPVNNSAARLNEADARPVARVSLSGGAVEVDAGRADRIAGESAERADQRAQTARTCRVTRSRSPTVGPVRTLARTR
jgi:hypothetical protein